MVNQGLAIDNNELYIGHGNDIAISKISTVALRVMTTFLSRINNDGSASKYLGKVYYNRQVVRSVGISKKYFLNRYILKL